MNKLNLSLWLEDNVNLSNTDFGKTVEFNFNGEIWEFELNSIAVETKTDDHFSWLNSRTVRSVIGSTYNIDGVVRNKSKKLLKEAKEEVRKRQKEFKDAQRKLSELMGNKI